MGSTSSYQSFKGGDRDFGKRFGPSGFFPPQGVKVGVVYLPRFGGGVLASTFASDKVAGG